MEILKAVGEQLKFLHEYGLLEIIFGAGVLGLIGKLIRTLLPSNYEHLHTGVFAGAGVTMPHGSVKDSIEFHIRNAGGTNFYIARAYFRAERRCISKLWLGWCRTPLAVHPYSARIAEKNNAFELKFSGPKPQFFTEYEDLVRPGGTHTAITWLALEKPLSRKLIDSRNCGVLYIEYATVGKQGTHVVRV